MKEKEKNLNKTNIIQNKAYIRKNIHSNNVHELQEMKSPKKLLEEYKDKWIKISINQTKKNIFTESLNNNKLLEANLQKESLYLKLIEQDQINNKLKSESNIDNKDEILKNYQDKLEKLKKTKEDRLTTLQNLEYQVSKNNPLKYLYFILLELSIRKKFILIK